MLYSSSIQQKLRFLYDKICFGTLCKALLIIGLVVYLLFIFLFNNPDCPASEFFSPLRLKFKPFSQTNPNDSPTNVTHLVFGLLGSVKTWKHRRAYIEPWWVPNTTRGYLYLDREPTVADDLLPWPPSSPPFRVSENMSRLVEESGHKSYLMVKMVHGILELYREEHEGLRWYIMGDDDSIFFVENMVDVLGKYDHTKYYYIGGHSETLLSNAAYSFEMAFGGGGFALSFALAEAMAKDLEKCLWRYPYLRSADQITMACVDDVGVPLTVHRGFHQTDLVGDISGFLSAHPQASAMSLHHFDVVDPIFPTVSRLDSAAHLMKAGTADQSRLFQQTICHHRQTNWSISISWGYSAHIYENIIPRSVLKIPIETFRPWMRNARPPQFLFDTRRISGDPCQAPHVFFFESVGKSLENELVTTYVQAAPRQLPACSAGGNHSADHVFQVRVLSPAVKRIFEDENRSECCDFVHVDNTNITEVRIRACMKNEILA